VDKTKILNLIAKLRNVTFEKGANPNEVAMAAERAQALLQEHQLTVFDVENRKIDEDLVERVYETGKRRLAKWVVTLASNIANPNGCELVLFPGSGKISFLGYASDVEVVEYLFITLSRVLKNLAQSAYRERRLKRFEAFHFTNQFITAAAWVIGRRLHESAEHRQVSNSTCNALAIVKDKTVSEFMAKQHPTLRTKWHSKTKMRTDAFLAGSAAGESVELRKGLRGGNNQTTLLERS
jgi:hypothetical protein